MLWAKQMKPSKPRYKTTNWPAYNRALQKRGDLTIWFFPELPRYGNERIGKIGRPTRYSVDLEKQIVFRANRLICVRKLRL
jgi:hypothetical protein